MLNLPKSAFVLCAGMGTRMRPLTNDTPKPLVKIFDRPILDHIFDHLKASDIEKVTLNGHYKADQIEAYAENKSKEFEVSFSYEYEILDTGGGLKKGLYTMPGNAPFYAINGDAYWVETPGSDTALTRLAHFWNPDIMDVLLLLEPVKRMSLTKGVGDYDMGTDHRLTRNISRTGTHMFTGIRLVHPRVFEFKSFEAFSFLECMDEAQEAGRLFGIEHDGLWHHLSTPEDIQSVRAAGLR